jgi:hypothetical protein
MVHGQKFYVSRHGKGHVTYVAHPGSIVNDARGVLRSALIPSISLSLHTEYSTLKHGVRLPD